MNSIIMWDIEWIGTWRHETLNESALDGVIYWTNRHDYAGHLNVWGTRICEALGYVMHLDMWHRMNRHDYVRHMETWDTKRIGMIMWDAWMWEAHGYARHMDMRGTWTWLCETLGCVRHVGGHDTEWIGMIMWDTEWIGTWVCETLGCAIRLESMRHRMNRHLDIWGAWICDALGCVWHLEVWGTWEGMTPNEYAWLCGTLGGVRHWINRHLGAWLDVEHRMNRHLEAIRSDVWHRMNRH